MLAADVMAKVAAELTDWCDLSILSLSDQLEPSLALRRLSVSPREGAYAKRTLERAAENMSVRTRAGHVRALAEMVHRSNVFAQLHLECEGSGSSSDCQGTLETVVSIFQFEVGTEPTEVWQPQTVAIWMLARLVRASQDQQIYGSLMEGSDSKRYHNSVTASARNRWGSHRPTDRRKDLVRLCGEDDQLVNFYDSIVDTAGIAPEINERVLKFHIRSVDKGQGCYCQEHSVWLEVLLDREVTAPWLRITDDGDAIVERLERFSTPRTDMVVVGRELLAVSLEGVSNSILLTAMATVGDVRTSSWQEAEAEREVRSSFKSLGGVTANVPWVTCTLNLEHHDGEIDVLVRRGGFIFDFQAKAPTAARFRSRFQVAQTDAWKQHQSLNETLLADVYLLRGKPGHRQVRDVVSRGQHGTILAHIPITVTAEVVREWSVGGGGDPLGRVTTSLDHMRMVNRYVPAIFRPAYWIDRHFTQKGKYRFVDEIDFLGRWFERLCGHEVAIEFVDTYAKASLSPLEQHYWLVNTFGETRSDPTSREITAAFQTLSADLPNLKAATFVNALGKAAENSSTADWIPLALYSIGCNFDQLEERMRAKVPCMFKSDNCTWAVAEDVSEQDLRSRGIDLALVKTHKQWTVWVNPAWKIQFFEYFNSSTPESSLLAGSSSHSLAGDS